MALEILSGVMVSWFLLAIFLCHTVPAIRHRYHTGDWHTSASEYELDSYRPQWCEWVYAGFVIAMPFMGFALLFVK